MAKESDSHELCNGDDCEENTQHKSGLCEKCRTFMCEICKGGFVASKDIRNVKAICSNCRRTRPK